jgi:ferredoxin
MAKIYFRPAGVSIEVRDGTTVFAAALAAEVAIPSQCGGRCACALCRVQIVEGAEFISPMQWQEEGHMGNCFHLTGERLSCQSRAYGEVVVEIKETEIADKPRSRYIPRSIVRKREKMEREEELRRVRVGRSPGAAPASTPAPRTAPGKGPSARQERPARRRSSSRGKSRRRGRNPGSLRPGQTRPPPGAKGKSKEDRSAGEDPNSG